VVQQEYDRYFANLGPRFAQGDCELRRHQHHSVIV
jgi:hypothetical protein